MIMDIYDYSVGLTDLFLLPLFFATEDEATEEDDTAVQLPGKLTHSTLLCCILLMQSQLFGPCRQTSDEKARDVAIAY